MRFLKLIAPSQNIDCMGWKLDILLKNLDASDAKACIYITAADDIEFKSIDIFAVREFTRAGLPSDRKLYEDIVLTKDHVVVITANTEKFEVSYTANHFK